MALIPARGGSKRLPGKNVRLFAGAPLIATTIQQAFEAELIDKVLVSTEDEVIANVARAFGCEVVDRPGELASDTTTTGEVLGHAFRALGGAELVVTLQPTDPLRPVGLIDRAIESFLDLRPDSIVSLSPTVGKHGRVIDGWFEPDYMPGARSQDFEPLYRENGLVYVTAGEVAARGEVFGSRMAPLIVDELFALGDIDTLEDFERAERLFVGFREQLSPVMGEVT